MSSGQKATFSTQDACPLSVPARLACCLGRGADTGAVTEVGTLRLTAHGAAVLSSEQLLLPAATLGHRSLTATTTGLAPACLHFSRKCDPVMPAGVLLGLRQTMA